VSLTPWPEIRRISAARLAFVVAECLPTSDAERLRKKWFAELDPLHRNAFGAKPLDSGRANLARQAVIVAAKPAGWKPGHVAASLALTGAERLTADRDFGNVKDDLRKAFARVSRR